MPSHRPGSKVDCEGRWNRQMPRQVSCRSPVVLACVEPFCSSLREVSVDRVALWQLTLAGTAASHPIVWMNQLKCAAHVRAIGTNEIRHYAAGIVSDKFGPGVPEAPVASPASTTPSSPQRAEVVDRRVARDLKELPGISLAIG